MIANLSHTDHEDKTTDNHLPVKPKAWPYHLDSSSRTELQATEPPTIQEQQFRSSKSNKTPGRSNPELVLPF